MKETMKPLKLSERGGLSCRVGVWIMFRIMVTFPLSLHSISVSILFCKDNHLTQVVQFFWTFSVEKDSFHILTNFTLSFLHEWTTAYICVWCTENKRVSLNRTWRGNKLLLKGLFLWARLARLAGLIRLTKFLLRLLHAPKMLFQSSTGLGWLLKERKVNLSNIFGSRKDFGDTTQAG